MPSTHVGPSLSRRHQTQPMQHQPPQRPVFTRGFASSSLAPTPIHGSPTIPPPQKSSTVHVKRVTLTSKKNWWMVEMDEEEQSQRDMTSFSSSEETAVDMDNIDSLYNYHHHPSDVHHSDPKIRGPSPPPSSQPIYNPPRHPNSLFSLSPCAHGSASELFKCIVKKPDVVQLEINGEMQSNASDVTVQFLAELRVYTTLSRHRNVCAFLGSLENVGMVLEFIDGRTLYDVVIARPPLSTPQKISYHNQLLDGLAHLHSYGLSHGDLSLLNVQVTEGSDTIKLLDFGRSVAADSLYTVRPAPRKTEQIHPGTRPFCAPEVLRGECQDARLADAYSFGMILVCLDRCESVDDLLPADHFDWLRGWDAGRRRLMKEDMMEIGP
ncbi:kinase-like domain-containing protein [Mycena rebaudengoi]|nr:kinase-like domain-containing protein [Mycena rebaudengoi]